MQIDFLSIGDTVIDDFIRLQDAEVHCNIDTDNCMICMRFADKIPFESSTPIYGAGNAANAAVCAARLGLSSAFVANTGADERGQKIVDYFSSEKVDTSHITLHKGIPTNYHYVLWYQSERTILIKHQEYPYSFPKDAPDAKTVYLSSLGQAAEAYHDEIADYLDSHPNAFFAFQPGTFQMKLGTERLKRLYARADYFVVNREEAGRILKLPPTENDPEMLAKKIQAFGPKRVIITDGRNGINALDGNDFFHMPMFPDERPPVERTGAGDAFASTTAAYLTMGYSLKDAMKRGTINSAYVVQEIGPQRGLLRKDALEAVLQKSGV